MSGPTDLEPLLSSPSQKTLKNDFQVHLKRFIAGGKWALGGKLVTLFCGLAVNALLARLLPLEEMGAYFLTFSIVSFLAMIAQMGLNQTVVRLVAEALGVGQAGRAHSAIRIVLIFGTLGSLLTASFLGLGGGQWLARRIFDSPLIAGSIILAAGWLVVISFQSLLSQVFRGLNDIRFATIFGGMFTGLVTAVLFSVLWIIQGHSSLSKVIVLSVLAGIANALIAGVLLHGKVQRLEGEGTLGLSEVVAITWPLFVTNLTLTLLTHVDIWILGAFRPQGDVAIYGAAARGMALVTMPLLIVNAVLPPMIAGMYARGDQVELENLLRHTATLAFIPALGVVLVFIFFGGPILELVYGEFYGNGATILGILAVGQLVNVWAGSCGFTLMMTGNESTLMGITAASGMTMVILCFVLVGKYGPVGVALAAATGISLQNIALLVGVKMKTGMKVHAQIPRLFLS